MGAPPAHPPIRTKQVRLTGLLLQIICRGGFWDTNNVKSPFLEFVQNLLGLTTFHSRKTSDLFARRKEAKASSSAEPRKCLCHVSKTSHVSYRK